MSKRAYIFYLLVLIIGFGIAYVSGIRFGTNNNVNKYTENKSINTNSLTDENSEVEGYWIIAVDNKLKVYKKDKKTIMAETDIDISDFSLKEKNMLQNGVYYENAEELFKYLESNTSWYCNA